MYEIIDNLLARPVYYSIYYLTQAVGFVLILWFMLFRADQFVKLVMYGGLAIAITAGVGFILIPLLAPLSLLLILVALLVVVVAPLWVVFGD